MKKVLFIRPDKAGDALKTLPVLRALLREKLDHEYHLLLSNHNYSLFEMEKGLTLHRLNEMPDLEFDTAILLPCDLTPEIEKLLQQCRAKAKFSTREIPLPRNSPANREETKNIATLVGNALHVPLIPAIYEVNRAPAFATQDLEEAQIHMGTKIGTWLGICPFAGTENRTHPFQSWQKLIPKITKANYFDQYFIFGTGNDRKHMQVLEGLSQKPQNTHLCFPSNFRALGAYLNRLDGIVAVDSGPLHLAHSLSIPSLGVLSGGDVERWFKRISSHDVLIPRGLFSRYPSAFEMWNAFKKWQARLLPA